MTRPAPRWAALLAFALSGLLYPASAAMLAVAAGALRSESLPSPGDRGFALNVGLLMGAFGVWTLPLALGMFARSERAKRTVEAATNPWVTCIGLSGLAAFAVWKVGRAHGLDGYTAEVGLLFLLGAGSQLWLAAGEQLERRRFGERSFELATAECRMGAPVEARLKLQYGAKSVEATLELYAGSGDTPVKTLPARVSEASEVDGAFVYVVSAALPDEPAPDDGGGWLLAVKAVGRRGGVFQDNAAIDL